MKRKVILLANKTFVVSLPAEWAKKYNVKKGDEVEVADEGNILTITTKKEFASKGIEVELNSDLDHFIRSVVGNAYKKGYDDVKILFDDICLMPKIQKVVDGLLGFEIIEQQKGYCTIKNVAGGLDMAFDDMLRKCFLMLLSMSETCLNDVKNDNFGNLIEIAQLDKNMEKFSDFCKRYLNRKGHKQHQSTIFTYLIIWDLEKIEKEYKYIYTYLSKKDQVMISKATIKLFEETNNLLRLFYQAFYEHNNKNIEKINKLKNTLLWGDSYKIIEKNKLNCDSIVTHHLANIIRRVYELGGPYFGATL